MNFFGHKIPEDCFCEISGCGSPAVDIHHIIPRSKFGSKMKDVQDHITNLIGICRVHHDEAHNHVFTQKELLAITEKRMEAKYNIGKPMNVVIKKVIECKKVKFSDQNQAEAYIKKLKNSSTREIIPVITYLCTTCLAWHLTSRISHEMEKIKQLEEKCKKQNILIAKLNLELKKNK